METIYFKKYQTELENGSKGKICIPVDQDLKTIIQGSEFIKDSFCETVIRSSAIVFFEHVGYEERLIDENGKLVPIKTI